MNQITKQFFSLIIVDETKNYKNTGQSDGQVSTFSEKWSLWKSTRFNEIRTISCLVVCIVANL